MIILVIWMYQFITLDFDCLMWYLFLNIGEVLILNIGLEMPVSLASDITGTPGVWSMTVGFVIKWPFLTHWLACDCVTMANLRFLDLTAPFYSLTGFSLKYSLSMIFMNVTVCWFSPISLAVPSWSPFKIYLPYSGICHWDSLSPWSCSSLSLRQYSFSRQFYQCPSYNMQMIHKWCL